MLMHLLCFVLCCAYHVDDKMSQMFLCIFWTPLGTKIHGDNHVFLLLKHQIIICFHALPLTCSHALVAHFCI